MYKVQRQSKSSDLALRYSPYVARLQGSSELAYDCCVFGFRELSIQKVTTGRSFKLKFQIIVGEAE